MGKMMRRVMRRALAAEGGRPPFPCPVCGSMNRCWVNEDDPELVTMTEERRREISILLQGAVGLPVRCLDCGVLGFLSDPEVEF